MHNPRHRCRSALLLVAASLALAVVSAPAAAQRIQWYVEALSDPISNKPVLEARVLTHDGYAFKLMRRNDNSLWGEFTLPRSSRATLSTEQLPIYRIDGHDPVDLNDLKKLEISEEPTLYRVEGRTARFILWGDARRGFIPPVLRQLMLGETLHVSYFTILGQQRDAQITLRRANEAIAQFLQVRPLNPDADAVEEPGETFALIARRFQELCDDLRFTGNDTDYTRCRDTFFRCSETPGQTAESFSRCLGLDARETQPAASPAVGPAPPRS